MGPSIALSFLMFFKNDTFKKPKIAIFSEIGEGNVRLIKRFMRCFLQKITRTGLVTLKSIRKCQKKIGPAGPKIVKKCGPQKVNDKYFVLYYSTPI